MGSRLVVVAEIGRQPSLEMTSVQDDVMVETLSSNRADESLGVWVLPWTLRCSQNLLHTQRFDSQSDLGAVPAVPVADEISGGIAISKRLYDLLRSPITGRMLGYIEVQQLATIVFQHDEYEQHSHRDGRHGKEMCVQRRLAYSVGVQSHLGKSQSPVAWIAGRKETEFLKPIDKAISRMVSKSPGRNVSEPIGGLENRIRRSSLHFLGEDSMDRRN